MKPASLRFIVPFFAFLVISALDCYFSVQRYDDSRSRIQEDRLTIATLLMRGWQQQMNLGMAAQGIAGVPPQAWLLVVDGNGVVRFSSRTVDAGQLAAGETHYSADKALQAKQGEMTFLAAGGDLIESYYPLTERDESTLYLEYDLSSLLHQARNAAIVAALQLWGAAAALSLLLYWLIRNRLTLRLERLSSEVAACFMDDAAFAFDDQSRDEIGALGRELARVAQKVAQNEANARARIVAEIPQALLVYGADLTIILCNRAASEFFGGSENELLGKSALDSSWGFVRWDGSPLPLEEYPANRMSQGKNAFGDLPLGFNRQEKSARRWALVNGRGEFSPGGKFIRGIASFVDVTDCRNREAKMGDELRERELHVHLQGEEIEALNTDVNNLSYALSHELKAPLRAVDGFARILQEDHAEGLDEKALELLDEMRANTRKMGELIDDILVFIRVKRRELELSAIDMNQLAKTLVDEFKAGIGSRRVRFTLHHLEPAQGEPELIRVLLYNLIDNALKFSIKRETSLIEIGCRVEGGTGVYYVKDNGAGFDMSHAHRLFSVFQRLHGAEEFAGVGLGLATVKRIIDLHGGRVWAQARVEDGATFNFTLRKQS